MKIAQKDNAVHLAKQIDDFGHDIRESNINNSSERIHRHGTKYNMRVWAGTQSRSFSLG